MVRFDDAIPAIQAFLHEKFADGIQRGYIVRDISGTVVLVLPDNAIGPGLWDEFAENLHARLGAYSGGPARVLVAESDLIEPEEVINSKDKTSLDSNLWLIDRLLTNQDWVRTPLQTIARVPTAVAYSVKGGVGRSTAFAMLAWHLARSGRDVLVVDLDLEAPGIGSLLLTEHPNAGLIDWLTESLSNQADAALLESIVGESSIGRETAGRVRVIPAYGSGTTNYVSKLGRIYASTFDQNEKPVGLAERLDALLEAIMNLPEPPQAVLLDARAGLHDIGSAVVTRLGAEAFIFARNDEQDWWAYRQLFDHLKHSNGVEKGMGDDSDLRWKLKMVAAQTLPLEGARKDWVNRSYEAWNAFYDDETAAQDGQFEAIVFDRTDQEAPHFPLFVNFDLGVRGLSLEDESRRPEWDFVQGIFGDFFRGAEQRLWPDQREGTVEGTA